jgi:hypothetical protein
MNDHHNPLSNNISTFEYSRIATKVLFDMALAKPILTDEHVLQLLCVSGPAACQKYSDYAL